MPTTMPDGPFDLVLCRNVAFTSFDADVQRQILRRIVDRVVPWLALRIGKTASQPGDADRLEPWSRPLNVYRRREGAPGG